MTDKSYIGKITSTLGGLVSRSPGKDSRPAGLNVSPERSSATTSGYLPSPAQSEVSSHLYTGTLVEGLELLTDSLQGEPDQLANAFAKMLDSIVDSGLVTSTLYKIDDELKFLIMETYLKDRDLVHRFKYYKERNRERDALAAIGRAKRELEIVSGSETSGSSQGDLYSPEETNPVAATHFEEFVGLLTAFLEICFTALIRPVSKTIFALLSRPDTKYDLGYCLQTMFSFLNVVLRHVLIVLTRLLVPSGSSRITSASTT